MKIEGYLFVPYQGQSRFSYDATAPFADRFGPSDAEYDVALDIDLNDNGTRFITCSELVSAKVGHNEYRKAINDELNNRVLAQLAKSPKGTVVRIELGQSKVNLTNRALVVYCDVIKRKD
jgi:hypothetical protein